MQISLCLDSAKDYNLDDDEKTVNRVLAIAACKHGTSRHWEKLLSLKLALHNDAFIALVYITSLQWCSSVQFRNALIVDNLVLQHWRK